MGETLLLLLVRKLCLGTHDSKLRFESWISVAGLSEAGSACPLDTRTGVSDPGYSGIIKDPPGTVAPPAHRARRGGGPRVARAPRRASSDRGGAKRRCRSVTSRKSCAGGPLVRRAMWYTNGECDTVETVPTRRRSRPRPTGGQWTLVKASSKVSRSPTCEWVRETNPQQPDFQSGALPLS